MKLLKQDIKEIWDIFIIRLMIAILNVRKVWKKTFPIIPAIILTMFFASVIVSIVINNIDIIVYSGSGVIMSILALEYVDGFVEVLYDLVKRKWRKIKNEASDI